MGTTDADAVADTVLERVAERLPLRLAVTDGVREPPRVREPLAVANAERVALREREVKLDDIDDTDGDVRVAVAVDEMGVVHGQKRRFAPLGGWMQEPAPLPH